MPAAQHRKFDDGINQDIASFLLGEGYVYSSRNMLYDKIGIARKRGGITGVGATASTYNFDHLGALTTDDGALRFYATNFFSNEVYFVNTATGAFTLLTGFGAFGNQNPEGGRPFSHYGFLVWPEFDTVVSSGIGPFAVAGATGALPQYTFTAPASVVITAGDKRITCAAADSPLAHLEVGMIVHTQAVAGTGPHYVGRVTSLVSATAFEVSPTPRISSAGANQFNVVAYNSWGPLHFTNTGASVGGKVGMSYQGRLLLGNTTRQDVGGLNRHEDYPRRVNFSSTLLEGDASGKSGVYQGAVWISTNGFPDLNYFDIPGQDPLTAMSPTGFGDAVFFSAFRTFRLTGNLSTQYGTEQSVTWTVREIPNSVGCISERSMQRTPRGVIFAHGSGIYATDGSSMKPLMFKRIQDVWKGLIDAGSFAIYGSGLIRENHYYICGTSAGVFWAWMVNLDTLAWQNVSGKLTSPASWVVNSVVTDPSNLARSWGLKHFAGAGESMTGGQLVRMHAMFAPTSANRADSDGTTVGFELVTRPYTEDSPTVQKVFMAATIEYENLGGAGVGVTPFFNLDAAEIPASGVTTALPRQDSYTVTGGTNAAPIVLTIAAGHNISQGAWVRVVGVTGLTKANGLWRVGAVTGTTLTLLGSVGNAAYVSGGTVTCVDARDISLLSAVTAAGQDPAAVVYRINDTDLGGAAGADSFELYGITHTWETRELHEQ